MELRDVCLVQLGYSARAQVVPSPTGIPALQQGVITSEGTFKESGVVRIPPDPSFDKHLVSEGDVLLRSRGNSVAAWAVSEELRESAIALSPLYILRPVTDTLDPGYLAWLITRPAAQAHFARELMGTNVKMIRRSAIEALPIEIPALDVQRNVASAALLAARELALETRLAKLHNKVTALRLDASTTSVQRNDRNAK